MSDKKKGMEIDKMAEETETSEELRLEDEQYKEDLDHISDMFEQDDLEVPDSLSKENVASMLAEADHNAKDKAENVSAKKTVKKHIWQKPLAWAAAIAACFLLVAVPAMRNAGQTDTSDLRTFESYSEIYKMLDDLNDTSKYDLYKNDVVYEEDADMAAGEAEGGSRTYAAAPGKKSLALNNGAAPTTSGGEEHSDTYIQVEGVDEADKVKVDGKYLYFINSMHDKVLIYQANHGKAVKVSEISAESGSNFSDIFLNGDRLVAISEIYDEYRDTRTSAVVYDVKDREHPEKAAEYVQSGSPVSQRMVGNILYLVTDQYAYGRDIPYCGDGMVTEDLKAKDISCVPSPARAEYTVIGAVDTASGKELSHVTKAVLGGSQDIYSNGDNLYVAGTTYIKKKKDDGPVRKYFLPVLSGDAATMIIKVRLSGGNIKIMDSSVVKGTIDDQFSMDEKDGEFRIATTSWNDSGEQVNNLFVLDRHLKELGHVSGFARGESIKAVRYVKDKAYVITYEQTDPLFVIDLSDSKDPKIEGAVKIDGFSTLLVPLSEDRILGIGYDVKPVESWQETVGLKFVIFDVSDPSKPEVVTSKAVDGVFSGVQDDHRALVMLGDGENARFIIPCWKEYDSYAVDYYENAEESGADETDEEIYDEEYADDSPHGGVLTITASDDKIDVVNYDEAKNAVERCPVIGEFIYAICDTDDVVTFDLK